MTNEKFASAIAGFNPTVQTDTLQEKIDRLNERIATKVDKVAVKNDTTGYTADVLKGLYDADTAITQNLGYSRELDPYGNRYDAVEVKHGNVPYDMQGISKERKDAGEIGKSEYAMQMQKQQVANVFGKPVEQVTEQDMIDVANQQQVQKLADLAIVPGEERWIAPLAIGSAPINLTGSYVDEFGVKQDSSLNVPILSKKMEDVGQRGGAALGNLANEEVTAQAAIDPLQNAFAKSAPKTEAQRKEVIDRVLKESNLNGSGAINAVKAFAYTLGEGVVNTLDLVPETAQFVYGNIVGDKKWADSKGLYDTKESEAFKTWIGYNDEVVNKLGKETVQATKNAWENGDYWGLLGTLGEAAMTPELIATSLGYVAGMVLPGGVASKALQMTSKVGKTANAIKAADTTGKMTKAEALLQAEEAAGDGYRILKTMTNNVGFASEAEQFGRDAEALYKETYKEEMPVGQKMLVRPLGLLYAKLDALTAKAILMGKDPIAKAIPDMVEMLPEAMKVTMAGKVATLAGTTAAKTAGAFGIEGATEAVQTAMEKVAGEYKQDQVGISDVLEKEKYEIAGAGLLGGVGGNQMQVAGKTPSAVMNAPATVKKGVELATETPEQKTIRQNVEYSRPLKNEAMFAALSGNAVEVADRAEKVHGKLSAELDESAPKSHTYSKILKDSLEVAQKAGDEEAINNVYKTIAELDKDENVEFKATDLVKESGYEATKKLIELINQNVDTTDNKMQELKGRVTKDIQSNTAAEQRNAEIIALRDKVIAEKKRWSIMGTDEMDPILDPLTKVENTANEYLEGKKTLDDVNKEFAELGFMDTEGKADPSRPGLATYEKELTDQLLNTKTNKNLLKVTKGTNAVRLKGLTGFAQSRLNKLQAVGTKDSYQTGELIGKLKVENEKMLNTITNVLKTAKGLKNIDADTKKAYEAELKTAAEAAIESSKELDRRNAVLATVTRPEGVSGALAFQVDADGESIQAVTYKDGKPVKTKIADVVGDKVVPIEKYAPAKIEVAKPAVELKKPTESNVEPAKVEVAKEQDLSNLTKKQQEFMAKYKAGKMKYTAGLTRRYDELMEKAKQPKADKTPMGKPAKKESRARQIKAAAEIRISEGEDEAAARVKAMFKPEDEVKAYAQTLSDEDIAEMDRVAEEAKVQTAPVEPEGPLATVRASIAKVDAELSQLIAGVPDMEVKQQVKAYYAKKLGEIQADKTRLGKMIDRLETVLSKRMDRKYDAKAGNVITALVSQIDRLVKSMLTQLSRLEKMLKTASKQYKTVTNELKAILAEIDAIEIEPTNKPIKTTIGTVVSINEKVYGTPIVEVNGERVIAERKLNTKGELEAASTAINRALDEIAKEKMTELRVELKEMEKGRTSLGAKLLGRLLINFPISSPIHRILKRSEDSVFGQLTGNTFADTARLLEVLPKGFKEFFITDAESKQALMDNFMTMAKYIKDTKIGDIVIGKNRIANNIDYNGLIMQSLTKYMPVSRELKKGDKVQTADKKTYIVESVKGNVVNVRTPSKIPAYSIKKLSDITGVLEKQQESVPVDIIELLGTVVDGKLQIDEQTQNILKFYSAKMLVDTQKMVGLIQSMDESEMGQVLGIYDAEEQLRVKQDAMDGYVNSASIRKDIEGEVYQALGLKFIETAPEFTVESFKSALGVLVQAIAIENGSMQTQASVTGGKNKNLVKTNWESLPVERDALTKSIAKLQYLNENRNRPLPSMKKPADDNNRKVMNTDNPMDEKSSAFLNKQEKIAYTISPRLARWLAMDEADALKAMGYVDVKNAGLHVSEIDAQMARNDKLVREWEILKTFAKSIGDKKFYLKWGQTVSGRYTILNDINYQESKLHREFVVAEGSTELVDVNNKDARQMLEASILQGLDMDPDKLSPETASAKFNETFKVTDNGIEVAKDGAVKIAYEALRDGKIDAEAMAEVFADSEGHHGISSIELLVAWDKAIKDGTKLETHANLEIDAITSGMILTLLQIGSDVALRMAEKGGIYTAERLPELKAYVEKWLPGVTFTPGALIEAGKKHAAEIEDKLKEAQKKNDKTKILELRNQLEDDAVFKDLYSTIGVAMIGEVQAYKETLLGLAKPSQAQLQQLLMLQQIGDLNLKNIRSIAKSPVMVYIYGATVSSIKKKLTYSLGVDTLVKALKNASKLLKDGKDASAEMNFINGFLPENEWKFVNEFGAKIEKPAEMWEQLLAVDINGVIDDIGRVINATFGKAIEVAFDSRLGFVNKNRDAAKAIEMLVFQTYQVRLTDEIQKFLDTKYGIGRHKGESYKLSKEDLQSINQKLTDKGYGHNIVWYEDGEIINQTLNKPDTKGGIHSSKVTVGEISVGGQIKQFKPAVNTGAAPTISVHAIDGRMMLDVLNREIDGKYTGGNIYDAVVLSVNKAMLTDTADSYNTNMIETGFSRSVIADQLEMLENMFYTKDEVGNKQFDELTFNRVLASIGLRPEGELRDDYTKEANRIGLGIGKMLERLERAEMINGERLANSGKEFHSGHLYQMGSGVIKVDAANTIAKQFPVIDTIKRLLTDKLLADRKITHAEFDKAGVKLHKDTDYVVNLDDAVKGDTQIQSNANIAQIKTVEGEMTVTDKLWGSLGANDTVQIIASKSSREWLESEDAKGSPKNLADKMLTEVLKSDAKIVANGFDVKLEESGRVKVDGVWVKNETTSDKNLNTTEDGNSIYAKLGDKTEVGNVKIVKNIFANKYDKNIITAFRVDKKMGLLESFNKYNAIGNPIDWQKFTPRFKNDNATKAFIDWFLGNDYKELEQNYRQALLNSLDNLKGKKIEYYKELGRPSHATALDYLVNTRAILNEGKADTQEEVGKIGSVQYVQDKIAPWIELDELTKQELAKITDKSALDKIAEDINCRKG